MRKHWLQVIHGLGAGALALAAWGGSGCAGADDALRLLNFRRLTNGEAALTLSVSNGLSYRLDAGPTLPQRTPLVSWTAAGSSLVFTDTAAPYQDTRFYSAAQLSGTNLLTGDHFETSAGGVIVRPLNHATFLMSWGGKLIYNDPVAAAGPFTAFPKADLILVSHTHTDHFSTTTLDAVRSSATIIIAPRAATNSMSAALRSATITLTNGEGTQVMGLQVDAIPAYNSYHPLGTGNGYILTIGDKRFYMSGDTGAITEMQGLSGIDVAFVCVNLPFTMDVASAAATIRAFRPKVVYPYHYRNGDGTYSDLNDLKRRVGQDLGIEVRFRKWY